MSRRHTEVGMYLVCGIDVPKGVALLLEMLAGTGGNQLAAAKLAGVDYRTLKRWVAAARELDPKFDGKLQRICRDGLDEDARDQLARRLARVEARAST